MSEWPTEVLELRHICPDQKQTLFACTMEFDTAIVMGLMRREESVHKCKLKVIDLRGFHISKKHSVFGLIYKLKLPLYQLL